MHQSLSISAVLLVAGLSTLPVMGGVRPVVAFQKDAQTPKKAPCAVCSVRSGEGEEAVKATATHEGKTYYFCSVPCRDEFLKNPQEFIQANSPRPAPGFSLKDLNGRTVDLADYKGKVVLLDFWATWCAPCVAAMPRLQKLHDKYGPRGFAVVGIAIDEKGAAVVTPMVARKKVKYPVLLGTESAWTAYNVNALPALFLIDRQGQIVKQMGAATSHRTLEDEVRKLVAE